MPLTFTETPLYYKDSQGNYHRILSGADMTGYRIAAAQDEIDAGLVSAAAAQTLTDAQQAQARANIGANWVLLWENASPTSIFAAQTLALDLSSYDAIIVKIRRSGTSAMYGMGIMIKDGSQYTIGCFYNTGNAEVVYRMFSCSNSGVVASSGFLNQTSGSNDGIGIPTEIYGIKGVQTA